MSIISIPITPTQPNQAQYGLDSLALFKRYTRDSFLAAFGEQAPPFDPTKKPKDWFDTSVDAQNDPNGVSVYKHSTGVDTTGTPIAFKTFGITNLEASLVNLPGQYNYPQYHIAPTDATYGNAPINPLELCSKEDAAWIASLLNVAPNSPQGFIYQEQAKPLTGPFLINYPSDETRRMYIITNGTDKYQMNAGEMLNSMYLTGVGYPGHWNFDATGTAIWVVGNVSAQTNNLPNWDMPLRDLLPNEKLFVASPFSGVVVQRTDMKQPTDVTNSGGGFTDADRTMLTAIQTAVNKLLKLAIS